MFYRLDLSDYPIFSQALSIAFLVFFCFPIYLTIRGRLRSGVAATLCPILLLAVIVLWNLDHITSFTTKYLSIETNLTTAQNDVKDIEAIKTQIQIDELAISQTADKVRKVGATADEISQKSALADKKIGDLDKDLLNVQAASNHLNQVTDLLTTAVLATSDDRAAFMKLLALWQNPQYPYRDVARAAFNAAGRAVVTLPLDYTVPWSAGVDPKKYDLSKLKAVYQLMLPYDIDLRVAIVQYVGSRTDLPKKDVMAFFVKVIDSDPSLMVALYASKAFEKMADIKNGTVDLQMYDDWWKAHQNDVH